MKRFIIILIVGITSKTATSQTYPVTDRSLAYAAAYTVPKQNVQVEAGYYNVWDLGMEEGNELSGYSTRLRIGLSEETEIRGGISYNQFQFGDSGYNAFEDLEFGVKTKLIQEGSLIPAVYFLGNFSFPEINSSELTSPMTDNSAEARLIIEKYINDIFIIGGNVGWRSGSSRVGLNYVGAVRMAVTEDISIYAEYFGRNLNGRHFDFVDAAIEFWVWDGVAVDIAIGAGTTNASDGGFVSVGIAKIFE